MQIKTIITILLFTFFSKQSWAQVREIVFQGSIYDSKTKKPVPYVAVKDKNSGQGEVASKEGLFTIQTSLGSRLTCSSLGYKKTIIEIPFDLDNDTIVLKIFMYKDTLTLREVVIRPYPNRAQFGDVFVNKKIEKDPIQKAQDAIIEALQNADNTTLTKKEDMPAGATIVSVSPSEVITHIIERNKNNKNRTMGYAYFFDSIPDSIRLNNPHRTLEEIRNEMLPKKNK